MGKMTIRIVSLMAANADATYQKLSQYLSHTTGLEVQWIDEQPWQARQRIVAQGQAELVFLCGGLYVRQVDTPYPPYRLLAAPIMYGTRYRRQPIYFSDVIVRADSALHTFVDIYGATWAYNDPQSYSGYDVIRAHLAALGATTGYFGKVIESGSHQQSLRMVLAGTVAATAIDSIVLERELQRAPGLKSEIRVIETLGPSPILPVVCARHVAPDIRQALRNALLTMHLNPSGLQLLQDSLQACFVAVEDTAYDCIRRQLQRGTGVQLTI
jgi:phosphonate transport system substrate-binding protein